MGPKQQQQQQCQVCNQARSKYKCPSCRAPYCSLVCFKKHKEIPCGKQESVEEIPKPSAGDPDLSVERPINFDEPSEVLSKAQLESIASSSEIRNALKDESLQKLIQTIDSSPNPEIELNMAMGQDVFCIFTDKILSSFNP